MEKLLIYNKKQYRSLSDAWPLITSLQLPELITSINTTIRKYRVPLLQIVLHVARILTVYIGMTSRSCNVLYARLTVWSHWSTLLSYNWYGTCSHSPNNCIRLPDSTETTDILQHMMHVETRALRWLSFLCSLRSVQMAWLYMWWILLLTWKFFTSKI